MGQLPASRVSICHPFFNVVVDYAGPFQIKDGKLRNRKLIKCYVAIFICLSTKAVHFEVVSDLTSTGFLNVLKRFVSRCGLCQTIISENAMNFIGANNELTQISQYVQETTFQGYLNCNKILWKFIPSRSPHFGGIWESAVKSAKYHLRRVAHNINFTYEEFNTLIIQVEAVLNSRPLFPLSNDPNDLQPLTPGHFLISEPLNALPQSDVQDVKINSLSRYQHLQRILQHFWTRWSKDYLHTLQQRHKWPSNPKSGADNLVGSLVMLKEEHTHPQDWQLGRITAVHPGADGIVRVVSVKTRSGVVKRTIRKICILPMEND